MFSKEYLKFAGCCRRCGNPWVRSVVSSNGFRQDCSCGEVLFEVEWRGGELVKWRVAGTAPTRAAPHQAENSGQ